MSKSPSAASVKSDPSTSAPTKLVPESTAFLKIAFLTDEPAKFARSTIAFVKSAPSKLLSVRREHPKSVMGQLTHRGRQRFLVPSK